jgi:hypothetical protein
LQQALKSAGYPLTADGVFGATTEAALRRMYKSAGYPIATAEQTAPVPAPGTPAGSTPSSVVLIPRSELIALVSLPAFVVSTPVVGTTLDATSQIVVEAGDIVATSGVTSDVAAEMKAGMTGSIAGPGGKRVVVKIGSIGNDAVTSTSDNAGSGQSDPPNSSASPSASDPPGDSSGTGQSDSTSVVLTAVGDPFPASWLRSTVQAVITVQLAAKDSLLVPSIAVITGGKDAARVLKKLPDGSFVSIPVTETAQLSGRSAIKPEKSDDLVVGDSVRVN